MNKKHLFQNADKTLDGLKNLPKGKNLIRYRNCETENNYIRQKGFINMFNAWFLWEHFIHITKEGWCDLGFKVSLNSYSLIFKPCRRNNIMYTQICTFDIPWNKRSYDNPRWNWCLNHWCSIFLHLHKDLPANFGGAAKYFLRKILQSDGNVIYFVSDNWMTPSVKDFERQSRNTTDITYHIVGAAQKGTKNWLAAIFSLVSKHHWRSFLFWLDQTVTMLHYSKENFFSLIVEIFTINSCQY